MLAALPIEILVHICNHIDAVGAVRLRVVSKGTVDIPTSYIRRRSRERPSCFLSPSTAIYTKWLGGERFVSAVKIRDTTLRCYSRTGQSTWVVCRRMAKIIVPFNDGTLKFGDVVG